jgi:hypothetical protein
MTLLSNLETLQGDDADEDGSQSKGQQRKIQGGLVQAARNLANTDFAYIRDKLFLDRYFVSRPCGASLGPKHAIR